MEKMTKKEMFAEVIAMAETADRADLVEFAKNEIALLDKKAAKAKERAAIKKDAPDELKDAVFAVLTAEPQRAEDILVAIEAGEDVTVAKVRARLKKLVDAGEVIKEDMKIAATETSKARVVKAYRLNA